jgi:hypothetical protein
MFSHIVPPIQYGTTNVNKKINNQKPAVKINMNKTKPENCEKSNITLYYKILPMQK